VDKAEGEVNETGVSMEFLIEAGQGNTRRMQLATWQNLPDRTIPSGPNGKSTWRWRGSRSNPRARRQLADTLQTLEEPFGLRRACRAVASDGPKSQYRSFLDDADHFARKAVG